MKLSSSNPLVLVDDNAVDSVFIARCLEQSQLPNGLLYFSSGEEFLEHMARARSGTAVVPAMVLMDINMFPLDGFSVVEQLRGLEEYKELPAVIFYTNSDNPSDAARAKSLNAGYMEKFSSRKAALGFLNSLA